ncbi:DNA cytosine methyltransferase [Vibrio vulnificus]
MKRNNDVETDITIVIKDEEMKVLHMSKIGMNRGKKRIWLEFAFLQAADFRPGQRIKVSSSEERIEIEVVGTEAEGNRYVSRRGEEPLIEVPESLIAFADHVSKLRLVFTKHKITITPHHSYNREMSRVRRLIWKLANGLPLDLMSLFSGGGVFDRAAHEGLALNAIKSRLAVCVERETKFLASSMRNNSHLFDESSVLINANIEELDLSTAGMEVDAAIVSIPCTGASRAGRSKNKIQSAEEHSSAGHLFYYALNWLCRSNVPIIQFECVKEYLSSTSMTVIRRVLECEGYELRETVLSGHDFGAIENRHRMIAIAYSKQLSNVLGQFETDITHYHESSDKTVGDILESVSEGSQRYKSFDYLIEKEQRDIAAGKGFRRVLVKRSDRTVPVIGFDYAKCRSNEPFVPLDEQNPNGKSRLFTPTEHAAVKTVPLQIISGLPDTTAHQILGQSGIYSKIRAVWQWIGASLMDPKLSLLSAS